jgi:K+-sensing histidine kinase KdpD
LHVDSERREAYEVFMKSVLKGRREALALLAGVAAPLCVAAALVPVRTSFANTAAALVLVAIVVAVAVAGDRLAGAVAAISASAWFDFFLTRPYERFAISQRPDVETAISLLVVGLVVTELAARNRHHHDAADERMDCVAVIYELAELVAGGAPPAVVIERATLELIEVLHLRDCRYEVGQGLRRPTRLEHNGEIIPGALDWSAQMDLPGHELELAVESAGHEFGRFVLVPTAGWLLSPARRLVAIAIADQVGAALTERRRSA